jgi:Tol biopolymer transport system component
MRPPGARAAFAAIALVAAGACHGVGSRDAAVPAADHGTIAFTRVQEDVDRPGSDYRLEAEIWVMYDDGSAPRRLTRNTSDDYGAAWSPGGERIAFGATQFAPNGKGGLASTGQGIFLIDPAGGAQVRLTDPAMRAQFPSWSPDGRSIAFHGVGAGTTSKTEIFVIEIDGSGLRRLTNNAWADARPDWSPDGRQLAFQSDRSGSTEIYVMNADGSSAVQLTSGAPPAASQAPDWSPDGRSIVFQSSRDGNVEVYVMDTDGSSQTRLTNHPGRDLDPEWSPDGRRIAFDRDIPPIDRELRQLFVMNADGTGARALTGLPSRNGHAAWRRATASSPRRPPAAPTAPRPPSSR